MPGASSGGSLQASQRVTGIDKTFSNRWQNLRFFSWKKQGPVWKTTLCQEPIFLPGVLARAPPAPPCSVCSASSARRHRTHAEHREASASCSVTGSPSAAKTCSANTCSLNTAPGHPLTAAKGTACFPMFGVCSVSSGRRHRTHRTRGGAMSFLFFGGVQFLILKIPRGSQAL